MLERLTIILVGVHCDFSHLSSLLLEIITSTIPKSEYGGDDWWSHFEATIRSRSKGKVINGWVWPVLLVGPANRQGSIVAANIATSIVRSFELYTACIGMNQKLFSPKTCHSLLSYGRRRPVKILRPSWGSHLVLCSVDYAKHKHPSLRSKQIWVYLYNFNSNRRIVLSNHHKTVKQQQMSRDYIRKGFFNPFV